MQPTCFWKTSGLANAANSGGAFMSMQLDKETLKPLAICSSQQQSTSINPHPIPSPAIPPLGSHSGHQRLCKAALFRGMLQLACPERKGFTKLPDVVPQMRSGFIQLGKRKATIHLPRFLLYKKSGAPLPPLKSIAAQLASRLDNTILIVAWAVQMHRFLYCGHCT